MMQKAPAKNQHASVTQRRDDRTILADLFISQENCKTDEIADLMKDLRQKSPDSLTGGWWGDPNSQEVRGVWIKGAILTEFSVSNAALERKGAGGYSWHKITDRGPEDIRGADVDCASMLEIVNKRNYHLLAVHVRAGIKDVWNIACLDKHHKNQGVSFFYARFSSNKYGKDVLPKIVQPGRIRFVLDGNSYEISAAYTWMYNTKVPPRPLKEPQKPAPNFPKPSRTALQKTGDTSWKLFSLVGAGAAFLKAVSWCEKTFTTKKATLESKKKSLNGQENRSYGQNGEGSSHKPIRESTTTLQLQQNFTPIVFSEDARRVMRGAVTRFRTHAKELTTGKPSNLEKPAETLMKFLSIKGVSLSAIGSDESPADIQEAFLEIVECEAQKEKEARSLTDFEVTLLRAQVIAFCLPGSNAPKPPSP